MSGNYRSVFDIIGPVMIGPSSSHTAGAVAIGQAANKLFGGIPDEVTVHYYGCTNPQGSRYRLCNYRWGNGV